MTREELRDASESLRDASDHADGEAADQLTEYADQVAALADADRGPDHGRLARIQHALAEIEAEAGEESTDAIEQALAHVVAYRETVSGV